MKKIIVENRPLETHASNVDIATLNKLFFGETTIKQESTCNLQAVDWIDEYMQFADSGNSTLWLECPIFGDYKAFQKKPIYYATMWAINSVQCIVKSWGVYNWNLLYWCNLKKVQGCKTYCYQRNKSCYNGVNNVFTNLWTWRRVYYFNRWYYGCKTTNDYMRTMWSTSIYDNYVYYLRFREARLTNWFCYRPSSPKKEFTIQADNFFSYEWKAWGKRLLHFVHAVVENIGNFHFIYSKYDYNIYKSYIQYA